MSDNLDVVVVGSGFWGSAIARQLKKAGLNYVVLDNGDLSSGTRNSGAYTCLRWFDSGTVTKHMPLEWTIERIEKWINWLHHNEYIEPVGQWIWNKMAGGRWTRYHDCYLMKDVSAFCNKTKAKSAIVDKVEDKGKSCVIHTNFGKVKAGMVVLATGAWTDSILQASGFAGIGVEGLTGRAILVNPLESEIKKQLQYWKGEVITINIRPFKNYDLLPNSDNWWYFGATTEKILSDKSYDEMLSSLSTVFGESNVIVKKTLTGVRPVFDQGISRVSGRIVAATGGGRIGLALAGPAAEDVLKIVKENL